MAAIHIVYAHAGTQRPQDMLRSGRVERHHLEINRVMPIARAADEQRYRLFSVMRQVEAGIDADQYAIIMQWMLRYSTGPSFASVP